ncbi:MAG TPA: hypothetical protein VHM02_14840 [Thermoanaerobaculia bacterium]|nr:hypothetical protein [Thermoanaerobaculia bacterium]
MTRIARRAPWMLFVLLLTLAAGAAAQEPPAEETAVALPAETDPGAETDSDVATDSLATEEGPAAEAAPAGVDEAAWSSNDTRNAFIRLLSQHPPELGTILALDPTLLGNEGFLAGYPELAAFVAEHPEVRRNPNFYLSGYGMPRSRDALDELFEMAAIFGTFLVVALALAWLVRTVVEQKRWGRLARTQSEVHNKILDRFGSSEELLAYINTPAGARFLESAPIPVRAERSPEVSRSPVGRAMWSVQLGVVIGAAAIGMLLVGAWYAGETARALFALGAIALCVGLGFVGSAAVSIVMSRRLGLWQPEPPAAAEDRGFAA